MDQRRVYTVKDEIDLDSDFVKKIVDSIVKKHSAELDTFVDMVRSYLQMIKESTMQEYSDEDLQMQIIKLPTLLYFAGDGLEDIGAESEVAECKRKELYNEVVNSLETGTILDKKSQASQESETEEMLTKVYDRSYKKLKLKIDHAVKLLESMKKVLEIRGIKLSKGKGWDNGGDTK